MNLYIKPIIALSGERSRHFLFPMKCFIGQWQWGGPT